MAKKSGLGDFGGLEALFDDNSTDIQVKKQVRLSDIEPNRNQPRKEFDEDTIRELAESIEEHGLIQPILVRPLDNGMYQIVAGERRWRALRMLGWQDKENPVIIKNLTMKKQRKSLSLKTFSVRILTLSTKQRHIMSLLKNMI